MMSPDTPQQQLDGRTVREIVEHNHEMVSEPWLRRVVRQVLQSLEVQYGLRMPHRVITPDTLLILDSGDPMLLPSSDKEPDPDSLPETEARDLHDLAAVVHYAITLDLGKPTPLRGRPLEEYSPAFIDAIDRCLAPDPAGRPQTIEQLRALLGIAVLAPPVAPPPAFDDEATPAPPAALDPMAETLRADAPPPAAPAEPAPATPMPAPVHVPRTRSASAAPPPPAPARRSRWPLFAAIALVVLAVLAGLFFMQQQAGDDVIVAQPAPAGPVGPEGQLADAQPALVTLPQPQAPQLEGPVIDETASGAPAAPPPAPDSVVPPTAVRLAPQGTPPEAAVAGTTYKLQIKPWGTIVVDGVDRGASPPLKHLTLPPGEHTIRIVNPNFPEHSVTVQSTPGHSGAIELDFTEEGAP